ncbi:hypothetical protein HHL22_14000 [Hymenobacter sp. RP-2-7]|uniref:T9SS type A sorting domain-containing protein n=1 Tax=Hymenobacter polaris TaxID=2682546 RepID=A0A7Y0AFF2_9BACT|nr:hypothetical protein [Hymenobacter polaris]NML66321.1 hypothetical protein [Hymenobacter polaris]
MRCFLKGSAGLSFQFFLASATCPVAAQQAPAAGVLTACGPASLRLHVANSDSLPGQVSVVRLATGQPLFTATYRAPYGHRFDFAGVPAGMYLVRLRLGSTRTKYRVWMSEQAQLTLAPAGLSLTRR